MLISLSPQMKLRDQKLYNEIYAYFIVKKVHGQYPYKRGERGSRVEWLNVLTGRA